MTLKKLLFPFVLSSLLIISGCSGLSAVEYNNEVVDAMNGIADALEETTAVYDTGVPNIVTETSTIDVVGMQASLEAAKLELEEAGTLSALTSSNADQEIAVEAELTNYLQLVETYLTTYEEMVTYYSGSTFAQNLDQVATYDETLHTEYNAFIDSNNTLVDILAEYVN